jgi:hypothetical protein
VARLADDACRRHRLALSIEARSDEPRALARGRFLFDGADHDDPEAGRFRRR